MPITETRLADLGKLRLDPGKHNEFSDGHCAMEVVAWLAGENHTDAPTCASKILCRFVINLNDAWDDTTRQRLIPYLPRIIDTAQDGLDATRSQLALDWLIRIHAPAWLDVAGVTPQAQALRGLHRVDNVESEYAAELVCAQAKLATEAAKVDALAKAKREGRAERAERATYAVGRIGAGPVTGYAAGEVAPTQWDSAASDAYEAASEAAWVVSYNADGWPDSLKATAEAMAASALDLLDRMIDGRWAA